MDTVKIPNKQNCRMIAHRGLSYLETENTMPAFVAAGNRSYFGIETDVHVTSDGEFIIIHDNNTGRVAAGRKLSVEGNTFDLLRTVNLADRNGQTGRIDLRLPSLEEYLRVCLFDEKKSILELKNRMDEKSIEKMLGLIRETNALSNVIFISFSLANLIEMRRLLPDHKLMYLTETYNETILRDLITYRLNLDVYYSVLTPGIVSELHRNGVEVNAWTCDDPAAAERLIDFGVDYITTNKLE